MLATALAIFALWSLILAPKLDRDSFWSFVALYGFLFISFLQWFAVIYKSISIRVLIELSTRPDTAMSLDTIYESTILAGAYSRRLANLEAGGFIVSDAGAVRLTRKGQKVVRWIEIFQRLFAVTASG
jgi:hypothetical protein